MKKHNAICGSICLYGSHRCGFGWLAHRGPLNRDTALLGDGEPAMEVGATGALWAACEALRAAGASGKVEVFEPAGKLRAVCDVDRPGYFGDLKWEAAPVLVIEADAIMAAAEAA